MSKTVKWAEQARYGTLRSAPRNTRTNLVTMRTVCALCDRFKLCDNKTGAFICVGGCE